MNCSRQFRSGALTAFAMLVLSHGSYAFTTVPADSVNKWIQNGAPFSYILIDVRDSSELSSSGVLATDSVRPYNLSWKQGEFARVVAKLPKDVPIIVYCRAGHRSAKAAAYLTKQGFAKVYSMATGMSTWTGSKRDRFFVKPLSLLPAFSFEEPNGLSQ